MFSDSREDVGRSPQSAGRPAKPSLASAAEAYVVTPTVTLPDAGNLFQPISEIISESAPQHMQQRAAQLCLDASDLDRPYLTGVVPQPM